MSHIFVSYSRKDINFAQKIVDALAANNLDAWIDWKSIPKGEYWEQEIYRGIEKADAFLFLISPDSVISEMCNKEIAHALKNHKRILPVVVRDANVNQFLYETAKIEISKRNWIFCRYTEEPPDCMVILDNVDNAIEEMQKTIHTDYEWLKYHTELQVKALKWEQKKDNSRLLRGKELREAELQLVTVGNQADPQPTKIQREYIFNSQRNEIRIRSQITTSLIVGLGVMLALSFVAWGQRDSAIKAQSTAVAEANAHATAQVQAQQQSQIALSRQLAANAQLLLTQVREGPIVSGLLAVQSLRLSSSREAHAALLQSLELLPKKTAEMHHDGLIGAILSRDGKFMLSSGVDGYARAWDIATGKEISRVEHKASVRALAISPDSQWAVSGSDDGIVKVWKVRDGSKISDQQLHGAVTSLDFDTNGKWIVVGSNDGTAHVLEVKTGNEISQMKHDSPITCVVFSPDGQWVASGDTHGVVIVWSAQDGKEVSRIMDNTGWKINVIAFSPDGKWVASGDDDYVVKIWNRLDFHERTEIWRGNSILSLAFSPDSTKVIIGCGDLTSQVWDFAEPKEIARVKLDYGVTAVAFSPDGTKVVSGSAAGLVKIWDPATGTELARMIHQGRLNSVGFSPDGKKVFTAGWDSTIRVWDINDMVVSRLAVSGGFNRAGNTSNSGSTSAQFNPYGNLLLSSWQSGYLNFWHVDTAEMEWSKDDLRYRSVHSIAFSPNGLTAALASWDGFIGIVDTVTKSQKHYLEIGPAVYSVNFSPNGELLAAGNDNNTIQVWNTSKWQEVLQLIEADPVTAIVFSPDGEKLATGTVNGEISIWDIKKKTRLIYLHDNGNVRSLVYSSDGKLLLSASWDKFMRVFDAENGKQSLTIDSGAAIDAMSISRDHQWIASAERDNMVHVWDLANGRELVRLPYDGWVTSVSFSPDGRKIAASSNDGTVRIWLWQVNDLMTEACQYLPRNLTRAEWAQYVGDALAYQPVCPNLPIEPEVIITPTP